jgi:hypothetical protein
MRHARFAVRDCEHLQHRQTELSHREHGPLTMLHLSLRPAAFFRVWKRWPSRTSKSGHLYCIDVP